MGTQITSTDNNDSKQQMTVTTVAAGATLIAPGDLVIWYGEDLGGRNLESVTDLQVCRDKLREADFPQPAGEDIVTALLEVGQASSLVVITNGLLPAIKIDDVFIAYTAGYSSVGTTAMFMRRIDAAIERLMESTLKAA